MTGWRALLAAALFGVAAALALPPLTLLPLLFVAVPGLLALIDGARTWRGAARRGLVFGIAHHVVGLYWVTFAILVRAAEFWWAVPIAVPLLAAVLAVFIAVPCALARLVPAGWPRVLVLAGSLGTWRHCARVRADRLSVESVRQRVGNAGRGWAWPSCSRRRGWASAA